MYWFIPPFVRSGTTLQVYLFTSIVSSTLIMLRASLFCVLYMPVVGLIVQARPWFRSIVHVDCDSHHALHVRVLSLRFMLLLYT